MAKGTRYGIVELAEAGGVSRRTVRYYIQEGLLPAPLGVGRGRHYTQEHLERLVEVKALQERGQTLDEIRLRSNKLESKRAAEIAPELDIPRSTWSRVDLLPGLEIHVSSAYRLPSPGRLHELADWCRENFRREVADR
jgi:DNA-binding transcriptional MerR regulator